MKTFITIVLITLFPINVIAIEPFFKPEPAEYKKHDPSAWTWGDTVLQTIYTTFHVMDWSQTLHIARNPQKFTEANPILGKHPSEGRVNSYFALTLLGHTGISYLLPKPYRTIWQGTWIYVEYDVVQQNREAGIGISLSF